MSDYIYYCSNNENNDCQKKNECKRFVNEKDQCVATLYKSSCTEDNKHILFIKAETEIKEEKNMDGENK